ncbi:MAG: ATP-binding protein [Patulibacter sp.]|nr:ATP-binding protein [Patulibacter sp.]
MPGSNLNTTERKLQKRWKQGGYPFPTLRSVAVQGSPGLRGICNLAVDFDYPVTAICGRNGTGKSTILSLATLAFHTVSGHVPPNALRKVPAGEDSSYYTFRDFFFRGPSDPDLAGITIDWNFSDAAPVSIKKQSSKWMRYHRRPDRPVLYLGISRTIPASELSHLRSRFASKSGHPSSSLSDAARARLSEVMGRPYASAEVLSDARYAVRTATSDATYSSFNMGTGEDVLIDLINVLDSAPEGALVAIDEIELGLHPEALRQLGRHVQEIALERKLQIVVTTHSQHFLDALPRVARVMLQRVGTVHESINGPTTRFAMGAMAGLPNPELNVYCEDVFARSLIGHALDADLRNRVQITDVGSNSELAQQARFHQRANLGQRVLIAWDGDVSDADGAGWLKAAKGHSKPLDLNQTNWLRLPGGKAPERWVLEELDCQSGWETLAGELTMTESDAAGHISSLKTVTEPHRIVHELAQRTNLQHDESRGALLRALARLPEKPLESITNAISTVLANESHQDFAIPDDEPLAPA